MAHQIGIRRETKSTWERRVPLTPETVARLVKSKGLEVCVQSSARRVFADAEYLRSGATVSANLSGSAVVLGVKEMPLEVFEAGKAYLFFSHVIKGQSYNMPMLARIMEMGCTLIDYETVTDGDGRRLVAFGRFAGLAGMIDSLWAFGQRLAEEGTPTPLRRISNAHTYDSLAEAKAAVREAGEEIARGGLGEVLAPCIVGIAGYGKVASGVREILSELPAERILPEDVAAVAKAAKPARDRVFQVIYKEEHLVSPRGAPAGFELQHYYDNPEEYEARFAHQLEHLTVLMNCNYWDARYPRLVTKEDVRRLYGGPHRPRLRVVGDISCDIEGGVECTLETTEPEDPVYVYDPETDSVTHGFAGKGPVILAVDILPAELPREASEAFSEVLAPYVPALARADYAKPFEELDLPPELLRAVIVHQGQLTPDYKYIQEHLEGLG